MYSIIILPKQTISVNESGNNNILRFPKNKSILSRMNYTQLRISLSFIAVLTTAFIAVAQSALAVTDPPPAPTNVQVSHIQPRSAIVTWDASPTADSYILEAYGGSGTQVGIYQNITSTSKKVGSKALKSNKDYYVKVRGVNDEGGGLFSKPVYFRTPPAKVVELRALESGTDYIRLQWHKPRGTIKYYLIQMKRKGKVRRLLKKTDRLTESYPTRSFRNLNSMRKFRFRVRAVFNKANKGPYSDQVILPKRRS